MDEIGDYFFENNSTDLTSILSDPDFLYVKRAADIADYFLYGLSFASITANLLVLHVSFTLYKKTQQPVHLLVFSLTFADSLTCTMHQLYVILGRFTTSQSGFLLSAQMSLTWVGYSASGFSLCLLNVEKFFFFHYPLHYHSYVTRKSTLSCVAFCWALCVVYACTLLFWATSNCGKEFCLLPDETMFFWYVLLFSVLPVLSSALLSTYLWFIVQSIRRKSYNVPATTTATTNGRKTKSNIFIFIVTAWVAISWLPARGHYLFLLSDASLWAAWFGLIANYVLVLSPMINPLLTTLVDPNYRNYTKKLFSSFYSHYKRGLSKKELGSKHVVYTSVGSNMEGKIQIF
uniref:G-protein coupled receptors family 1 profile domain-containing protein n=1 Tax=Romanomermis culicivorax TaxID=13658 RepID=A0A915KA27_ROMCU